MFVSVSEPPALLLSGLGLKILPRSPVCLGVRAFGSAPIRLHIEKLTITR